ncbi:hypothetical protein HDV03_001932 [Kappamyces sp. JEL0829]|nr:hypothetical protein HDV03_001932 [Kappamyces sp. JEL0829]
MTAKVASPQVPKLPQMAPDRHRVDIPKWKTERVTLDSLEPTLIAKLPFIHQTGRAKRRSRDVITVHKEIQLTPVPSARPAQRHGLRQSDRKEALSHTQRNTRTLQQEDISNFIETVDLQRKSREVKRPPNEITSPLHLTAANVKDEKKGGTVRFVDSSVTSGEAAKGEAVVRVKTMQSAFRHPNATNPFCNGPKNDSGALYPWRDTHRQVFLWESRFMPKRIHENHLRDETDYPKIPQCRANPLAEKNTLLVPLPIPYKYPNRYLATDMQPSISRAKSPLQDEGSKKLDFLLAISELKFNERLNLERLQSVVQQEEAREERNRRKLLVDAKEANHKLVRKLYKL